MNKNSYLQLKEKHQQEVNSFPMEFAFSQKQFAEGMEKLGLKPEDTDKIYSMSGTGGFYKKTDASLLHEMFNRHETEMQQSINNSEVFIFDMFNYELSNHEYTYTGEIDQTLDALDLTIEEVNNNKKLLDGLKKACKYQKDNDY